jgi:hypothetical protein
MIQAATDNINEVNRPLITLSGELRQTDRANATIISESVMSGMENDVI